MDSQKTNTSNNNKRDEEIKRPMKDGQTQVTEKNTDDVDRDLDSESKELSRGTIVKTDQEKTDSRGRTERK